MKVKCPNCETSFVIDEGKSGTAVNCKDVNGTYYLVSEKSKENNLKKERINALKELGFDVDAMMNAGINLDKYVKDPVTKKIYENGYIQNTLLHRRFVLAHTMKLLGWTEETKGYDLWISNMNKKYKWAYQFDMLYREVHTLAKLEASNDKTAFLDRNRFFSIEVICRIFDELRVLISKKYTIYPDSIVSKYERENEEVLHSLLKADSYKEIELLLSKYQETIKRIKNLFGYNEQKLYSWTDAFKKEGAYYSLLNLIRFHNVTLWELRDGEPVSYPKDTAEKILRTILIKKEGYQLLAVLKYTLKKNNFCFTKSINKTKA